MISALSRMSILRAAAPEHYRRERVDAALADVVHRALFGPLPGVNVHPRPTSPTAPVLRLSPEAQTIFDRARELEADAARPGKRALGSILAVANDLIADRGYRGLRIDDVVRAAEVSRGSFYTYFDDIDDFVRVIGVRAIQDVSEVVRDLPEVPTRSAMRRWLRRLRRGEPHERAAGARVDRSHRGTAAPGPCRGHRLGAPADGDDARGARARRRRRRGRDPDGHRRGLRLEDTDEGRARRLPDC